MSNSLKKDTDEEIQIRNNTTCMKTDSEILPKDSIFDAISPRYIIAFTY